MPRPRPVRLRGLLSTPPHAPDYASAALPRSGSRASRLPLRALRPPLYSPRLPHHVSAALPRSGSRASRLPLRALRPPLYSPRLPHHVSAALPRSGSRASRLPLRASYLEAGDGTAEFGREFGQLADRHVGLP